MERADLFDYIGGPWLLDRAAPEDARTRPTLPFAVSHADCNFDFFQAML